MSWIPAEALEAVAWEAITSAWLDDASLERAFATLEAQASTVDAATVERISELEKRIAQRRRALDKITRDLVMDELDAERERSLRATASQIRDELKTMTRDPERFTLHTAQKSYPQQAASLQAFCDEIRLGIELATAAERRCAFEILQLRADLLPDPAGVKIGRHTYRIVWDGLIDLSGAYHQPSRLNSAASAAASTAMNPSTAANAQELSKDGVKWKFIP